MVELLELAGSMSIPALLTAIATFCVIPDAALRLIVLAYPKGHPRRKELINELLARVPRRERPFWVAEQILGITIEGVQLRRAARITPRQPDERDRSVSDEGTGTDNAIVIKVPSIVTKGDTDVVHAVASAKLTIQASASCRVERSAGEVPDPEIQA